MQSRNATEKERLVVQGIWTLVQHAGKSGHHRQLVEEHDTLPTCKSNLSKHRARLFLR